MTQAKKNRSAYEAYMKVLEDVKSFGNLPIPMNLRNLPVKQTKSLDEFLLPEKIKYKKYY